jgi:hypothetical protein
MIAVTGTAPYPDHSPDTADAPRPQPWSGPEYGPSQPWLCQVEGDLLEFGRDHDDRHITASCAKVVCATQNAQLRYGLNLRQRGDPSKNELSLGKHCGEQALDESIQWWKAGEHAHPSASTYVRLVLVEQHNTADDLVAELGLVGIAGCCCLHYLGGDMDAVRSRLGEGRGNRHDEQTPPTPCLPQRARMATVLDGRKSLNIHDRLLTCRRPRLARIIHESQPRSWDSRPNAL